MSAHSTNVSLASLVDVTIVYSIFVTSAFISVLLSIFIVTMIVYVKALHHPANLLICNTCVASILYVIITSINISCYYTQIVLSDWSCRIQGYLIYACLTMVAYSYLIQGISRLFFTVLSQHRNILNYTSHAGLILAQIIVSLLIPLPSLITTDIEYRPLTMCLIPVRHMIHVVYSFVSSYFVPLFTLVFVYRLIHRRVKLSSRLVQNRSRSTKRDLKLTRNILILFMIFVLAGVPSIIYVAATVITGLDLLAFYTFTLGSMVMALAIEKASLLFLNKDIRRETRKRFDRLLRACLKRQTEVQPFNTAHFTINRTLAGNRNGTNPNLILC
jgi:hypothetical protein